MATLIAALHISIGCQAILLKLACKRECCIEIILLVSEIQFSRLCKESVKLVSVNENSLKYPLPKLQGKYIRQEGWGNSYKRYI